MDDVPDEQNDDVAENTSTRETKTSENNNQPKFAQMVRSSRNKSSMNGSETFRQSFASQMSND